MSARRTHADGRRWPGRPRVLLCLTLLLLTALLLLGAFGYGFFSHKNELPPYRTMMSLYFEARHHPSIKALYYWLTGRSSRHGNWYPRPQTAEQPRTLTQAQLAEIERLNAVGYLGGTEPAPDSLAGSRHDPDSAFQGVNLFSSGHHSQALLLDMDGKTLHTWSYPFERAFPQVRLPRGSFGVDHWRRVHLYENGDLLAIFEGQGIIKLDKDSNLLWARHNRSHHDLFVTEAGEIYVLTRTAHVVNRFHEWKPILEDFISVLGPDGSELERFSILEAFENSYFAPALEAADIDEFEGDIFHTNTLELLDGSHEGLSPSFRRGNALISMKNLNMIAVIDLDRCEVVWALTGLFVAQHEPSFVANGNIVLFDNRGRGGRSRVLEIEPLTQRVVWTYPGELDGSLNSPVLGAVQRLQNGNTLITESTRGRAVEVSGEGEIVWEYYNPFRYGDKREMIAAVFEMKRLAPRFAEAWLE